VEPLQDNVPDASAGENSPSLPVPPVRTRQSLPPKGSCWYCDKPVDSVRRFCNKDCADAFDEEAEFTR